MILHFEHHKEGRTSHKDPSTGNYVTVGKYTNCYIYIPIDEFDIRVYNNNDKGDNYHYWFYVDFTVLSPKVVKDIIKTVNNVLKFEALYIRPDHSGVFLHKQYYPKVLKDMPDEHFMPREHETNPKRLVEILKF